MKISESTEKKRIKNVRVRARELLFSDGNYIALVLALFISLATVMLCYLLAALVSEFTFDWVSPVMLFLLGFFVCAPMVMGTVRVAVALYSGGENPLAEVFFAFSSYKTYLKTLVLVLLQGVKMFAVIGLPLSAYVTVSETLAWYLPSLTLMWRLIAAAMALGLFILLDRLTARFYGTLFYAFADGGVSVIGAIRKSFKNCKGSFRMTLTYKLTAWIFILLSAIPVCIPLIFYTVPYLLSRYVYAMAHASDGDFTPIELTEKIIETGDINNEQR